jgi:hypothetical protein
VSLGEPAPVPHLLQSVSHRFDSVGTNEHFVRRGKVASLRQREGAMGGTHIDPVVNDPPPARKHLVEVLLEFNEHVDVMHKVGGFIEVDSDPPQHRPAERRLGQACYGA